MGSKVNMDDDCSHKIKCCLLLGRKAMPILDSVFKSRDITLPTKVCRVKADFSSSHVQCTNVRTGPQSRLNGKELMPSNCGAGEDF